MLLHSLQTFGARTYPRQEQILREHVDYLSGGVIAKTIAKAALSVPPGHADVHDLVPVGDDVNAGFVWNDGPISFAKANALREHR